MKRGAAILLAVLMALSLTACTMDHSAELAALQAQLAQMQKQLEAQSAPESPAQQDALPEDETIYLFNAQADGQQRVVFKGHTTITAQAVIPEGMALEAWVRDGAVLTGEEDDQLTLNADATTFVEARLRPERTVRTINAQMRFLDEHDKPKGEAFEEFVFEYGYENPVTEQWHEGGAITVYVEAVVPRGYVIDHWVINDVPYYFSKTVSAFTVVELDESTVYEVVLREAKATPTPKPTTRPTATPAPRDDVDWKPTPTPVPTPEPTEEPVMYSVSCMFCSFDGKTSGMVPAGTVITVRGDYSVGDFEVNDADYARDTSAISVTINQDTFIKYIQDIN